MVHHVIIGGGIAGVTCAEHLLQLSDPSIETRITVISASPFVKTIANLRKISKHVEIFDIATETLEEFSGKFGANKQDGRDLENGGKSNIRLEVVYDFVVGVNADEQIVTMKSGKTLHYDKCCICTGASPKILWKNPRVIGIRDTDSVKDLAERVRNAKRVVVVGNGGIAMELVHELRVPIYWIMKDDHIGSAFLDPGASAFFLPKVLATSSSTVSNTDAATSNSSSSKMETVSTTTKMITGTESLMGAALGPRWIQALASSSNESAKSPSLIIKENCQVKEFIETGVNDTQTGEQWPIAVQLSNGEVVGCDVIVCATGVVPSVEIARKAGCSISPVDSGILVSSGMQTSIPNIFSAGDCVTANWEISPHWHQMRLWTQARVMGAQAARSMLDGDDIIEMGDFAFELFTHATEFFGHKVVLLGRFNAQGMDPSEYTALVRVTPGEEYIKVVLDSTGRMRGAVLIGDTGLEETFENLILNQLDLRPFGEKLLDPDIDVEDYFD